MATFTYSNGRTARLNDRVVAQSASGKFIGAVSGFQGANLRVHPIFCQSALYIAPSSALLLTDALVPDAEIVQVAAAPASPVPPTSLAAQLASKVSAPIVPPPAAAVTALPSATAETPAKPASA